MSKKALDELNRVREEILFASTICSWCGKKCEDNWHLFFHIILRHKKEDTK